MKILFITNTLPPIVDGVGDYTYNIAKQFAEHDHDVYIVCKKNPAINTDVEGITVLPIVEKWNFNCHKPIVKLIKEKEIEIVTLQYVPHGFHPKGLPFALIKLTNEIKKCGTKLFSFCHEILILPEKYNIKRNILSLLMKNITRDIINNSDYAATSNEYYKLLSEDYIKVNKELNIIPIASNIPFNEYDIDYLKDLRDTIAKPEETIISFFGKRNIISCLETVEELINEGINIKILSIGKTDISNDNIDKRFIYNTGILDVDEISKYIQVSDILLLPEEKGFGCSFKSGSLIAALQNGATVITTKGRMTSDLLINKQNVIFVDFQNKEELMEILKWCISNPSDCNTISNNAKKQFNYINWGNTYKSYIEILNI